MRHQKAADISQDLAISGEAVAVQLTENLNTQAQNSKLQAQNLNI